MNQQAAIRRFYAEIWPLRDVVLRTAQILAGNVPDAEDLAQETLLKAFRFIDTFRTGTDAKAWLLAILRNTRLDRLRIRGSAGHISLDEMAGDPADEAYEVEQSVWERPADVLNKFSDAEVIHALQALPEEIRWTLLLVDVEEIDHVEAARMLEAPVGTIKSRAHRGRQMLRTALLPLARDRRLVREPNRG